MGKAKKLRQYYAGRNVRFPCLPCAAEDHLLCMAPVDESKCCCSVLIVEEESQVTRIGPVKEAVDITDVQSTGRKRAAVMYPIEEGMICEWAYLKYAGGGVVPIVGCLNNPATDRHHGPDKNTLNNSPSNVHRICAYCHNYWHAKNDEFYGERPSGTEPFIPLDGNDWRVHDPETKASIEEVIKGQVGRKTPERINL
jgi:hypothetical protein